MKRSINTNRNYLLKKHSCFVSLILIFTFFVSTFLIPFPICATEAGHPVALNASYTLATPSQIITGSTVVPVRFISETAGFIVDYYGNTNEISIMEP